MTQRTFLGMLTPSSNTALEPLCAEMLENVPDVTAHFARFRVTEISLDAQALDQFDNQPMVDAAALLADAHVHAICWNGTSAGWLGFDRDRELCTAIQDAFGIGATTSVLALGEIFRLAGVTRYGMVTPYLAPVQEKVIANFRAEGFECIAERHLDIRENFAFSEVSDDTLREMVRDVATARPEAIMIFCTNLRAAQIVAELEEEIGIPIYDSTAAGVWGALRIAKIDPPCVTGWGSLFRDVH